MAAKKTEIRRGVYYDSIVLMELQAALAMLPGIERAGVMMGTAASKGLLGQNNLLTPEAQTARPDDLIISLSGDDEASVIAAMGQVDPLLARRRTAIDQAYQPKSLETAAQMFPDARWVVISVPGRYAASVAREALHQNKHIFLYSDNVPLADEISLKREAATRGLLVMGPDCGTALVGGVGLGFANRVRRGPIGLVGASGTGLQHVTTRIHHLGSGITHALGTGGRDLSHEVGGITARQALDLLRRDTDTKVIVLLSKPPDPHVASTLLQDLQQGDKPGVIYFTGYVPPGTAATPHLHVAQSLDEAADLAVKMATSDAKHDMAPPLPGMLDPEQRYVRGLFSGGTLAYEIQRLLHPYLSTVYSNAPLNPELALPNALMSQGHTILDLGADEFTVGRPHPMLDNTLRRQRLIQEAADPTVAILLFDVVLGDGAHPDPAGDLAPALVEARTQAQRSGRTLDMVAVIVGTDEDPQDLATQIEHLETVGVRVETGCQAAAMYVGQRLQAFPEPTALLPPVDLAVLQQPLQALNVGLESFVTSLSAQNVPTLHVDWRPPAGGDEKLLSILERMKKR